MGKTNQSYIDATSPPKSSAPYVAWTLTTSSAMLGERGKVQELLGGSAHCSRNLQGMVCPVCQTISAFYVWTSNMVAYISDDGHTTQVR